MNGYDQWRRQKNSPCVDYHFCQVFLVHNNLIPEDCRDSFWNIIESILLPKNDKTWATRTRLIRYYCKFLESQAGGSDGDVCAQYANWFCEFLSFERRLANDLDHDKLTDVLSELESVAEYSSCFGRPYVTRSSFYCATTYCESAWAAGTLAQIDFAIQRYGLKIPDDKIGSLSQSLIANSSCILSSHIDGNLFSGFDLSTLIITLQFKAKVGENDQLLSNLAKTKLINQDAVGEVLKEMGADQTIARTLLQGISANDEVGGSLHDALVTFAKNDELIRAFVSEAEVETLNCFIKCLQVPVDEEIDPNYWWQLPHILFSIANRLGIDKSNAQALLNGALNTALQTDALSVLDRAKCSDNEIIGGCIRSFRDSLIKFRTATQAPSWIKSKLNAFINRSG